MSGLTIPKNFKRKVNIASLTLPDNYAELSESSHADWHYPQHYT